MKKISLLIITLLVGFCALGQVGQKTYSTTTPTGTNSLPSVNYRYSAITPDSLNQLWLYNPLTSRYNRFYSATEANKLFAPATGGGYVPTTRLINTGYGLLGGGDLSADRTLLVDTTTLNDKYLRNSTSYQSGANFHIGGYGAFTNGTTGVKVGYNGFNFGMWGYAVATSNANAAFTTDGNNIIMTPQNGGQFRINTNYLGSTTNALNIQSITKVTTSAYKTRLTKVDTGLVSNDVLVLQDDTIKRVPGDSYVTSNNAIVKDSLTVGVYPTPTTSVIGYGTSIMVGSAATATAKGFFPQVASALNSTAVNNGVSASDLANFLNPPFFNGIPNYVSTVKYLFMIYGTNDVTNGLTVAQYQARVSAAIDSLRTLKSYPSAKIVWIGTPFNTQGNANAQVLLQQFAAIDSTVAAQKGIRFVEMYHYMKSHGGSALIANDLIHPNNDGHKVMFTHIMEVLNDPNLLANATINNNLTVNNTITTGQLKASVANIRGANIKSATIDTLAVPFQTSLNYTKIANPLDSLDFKATVLPAVNATRNTILLYNAGVGGQKVGIGTNSARLQIFGSGGILLGAGTSNYDAWTLNPTNYALGIDNFNNVYLNSTSFANNPLNLLYTPSLGNHAVRKTDLDNQKSVTEILTNKTISGANNTITIPLTTSVSGILPVANGGTNTGTAGIAAINNITARSYVGFTGTGNLVGSTSPTFNGTAIFASLSATAALTFTGTTIGSAATNWIGSNSGGGMFLNVPTSQTMGFGVNNALISTVDITGNYPGTDNIYTSGQAAKRWSNVYATTFTGSGTGLTGVGLLGSTNTWSASNTYSSFATFNGVSTFNSALAINASVVYNTNNKSVYNNSANTFGSSLGVGTLTANRNVILPDLSGTIALTSDVATYGTATLTAGVATITIPGLTTSSFATTGFKAVGGTVSTTWQYQVVCTTNTLTITAITNANTTNNTDTSTLNYSVKL